MKRVYINFHDAVSSVNLRPLDALEVLQAAKGHIARKGNVKPGWTVGDHDAYWMLQKRIEQILAERGIEFVPVATGAHMDGVL